MIQCLNEFNKLSA